MSIVLEDMGIEVKYHHHEVGGPGQCEIETPMMGLLQSGDATQMVKYVTKMVAHRRNQTATFMPKPLYGEAGNGMHFHQHLFKNNANVFYDENGYGHLSDTALYYIGGLAGDGPAVLAFTNPSTNSYRRLVPGFEAPVNAFFSLGNRSAAIRVPKYADQPGHRPLRIPPARCDLQHLSGAGGATNGRAGWYPPNSIREESGFGPIDQNIFGWSDEHEGHQAAALVAV